MGNRSQDMKRVFPKGSLERGLPLGAMKTLPEQSCPCPTLASNT